MGRIIPGQYFFFGMGIFLFLPAVVTLLSLVEKKGPSPIDSAVGVYSSLSPEEKEMAKRAGGKVLRGLLAVASGYFRKKGAIHFADAIKGLAK